jgi:GT2 family glycosyltransferase
MVEMATATQRHVDSIAVSVIVPVYENPAELLHSLKALARSSYQPAEVLVVDDGSKVATTQIAAICKEHGARYLRLETNAGPAEARNAGVKASTANVLVFLDADVAVHGDTLKNIVEQLEERPDLDALFGAYDDAPAAAGTVSRFRNLLHHYVHLQSAGKATTFWAGCGAVRRRVFEAAGGFPELYRQPSIEDVDFGHRLSSAGFAIHLEPSIQVTHVKRWTLQGMFRTDLLQRATPWTERFWEWGALPRSLNFSWANRICVMLTGFSLVALAMGWPMLSLIVAGIILAINFPLYRFISNKLGVSAVPVSVGTHLVHYCAAFLGLFLGSWRYFRRRDPAAIQVALGLLAIAGFMQLAAGAYTADFAGHPDESSHFVTSVMVSRFIDHPFQDPLEFAARTYLQYPKVAMGHWPPLGYLLQGLWMHATGVGRIQALALVLVLAVLAAFTLYELLWPDVGRPLAVGAAVMWLLQYAVRQSYQQVMMDIPVVLASLLALVVFRQYVTRPIPSTALSFGLIAALALLIKSNAIVLALVPPCYVVLGSRWDLIRRRDFWLAAAPPVLLAEPWHIWATLHFYRNFTGWAGLPGTTGAASIFVWSIWWEMGGVALAVAATVGLVLALKRRTNCELLWAAVLISSIATNFLFRAMGEPRHLLIALAAMIALSLLAMRGLAWPIVVVAAAMLLLWNWRWLPSPHHGYTEAAIAIDRGPRGAVLLSGPGDGAVIAAAAAIHSNATGPNATGQRLWLRAAKLMGNVSWSGRVISATVTTTQQVHSMLDACGINQVLLDGPHGGNPAPFDDLLRKALDGTTEWCVVALPKSETGTRLFRRLEPIPARQVTFFLPRLGRTIGEIEPVN